jgi:hypothetical protein
MLDRDRDVFPGQRPYVFSLWELVKLPSIVHYFPLLMKGRAPAIALKNIWYQILNI